MVFSLRGVTIGKHLFPMVLGTKRQCSTAKLQLRSSNKNQFIVGGVPKTIRNMCFLVVATPRDYRRKVERIPYKEPGALFTDVSEVSDTIGQVVGVRPKAQASTLKTRRL